MSNGQHYDWAKLMRQVGGKVDSRHIRLRQRAEREHQTQGPDLAHEPFECPSCGDRFPVWNPCPRCVLTPIDTRTGLCREEYVRVPAHGLGLAARLRVALVERAARRKAAAARRVRAPKGAPAPAPRARLRFRGIASVLRAVIDPATGEPCGAFARFRDVLEPCGCGRPGCARSISLLRVETAVGLLALRRDDQLVLVGVPRSVQRVAWGHAGREGDPLVYEGQEIEAVGTLEQRAIELPMTPGYRETPPEMPWCLVGTAADPCWLLV